MTSSVFINHRDLQQFRDEIEQFQRRVIRPSRFAELACLFRKAAKKIKSDWANFSPEERYLLQKLAYDIIEPSQGLDKLLLETLAIPYMFFLQISRQKQDFLDCLDALDELADIILDAIERQSPIHQKELSDILEEVISDPNIGEFVDGGNRRR